MIKLFENYKVYQEIVPDILKRVIDINKILPMKDSAGEYYYDGNLSLDNYGLTDYSIFEKLNITFIKGDLSLNGNNIGTLKGCPNVSGELRCVNIGLTSLEGCPKVQTLLCNKNKLKDLIGCHPDIEVLSCDENQLVSLEGCPTVLHTLFCNYNRLTSLVFAPKKFMENSYTYFGGAKNLLLSKYIEGKPSQHDLYNLIPYNEINNDILDSIEEMSDFQKNVQLEYLKKYDDKAYNVMLNALKTLGYDIITIEDDESELF